MPGHFRLKINLKAFFRKSESPYSGGNTSVLGIEMNYNYKIRFSQSLANLTVTEFVIFEMGRTPRKKVLIVEMQSLLENYLRKEMNMSIN